MPTKNRQTKSKPAAHKRQRTSADILADLDAARAKIRDAHAELHILRCPEDAPIEMPPAPPPAAPQLTLEQRQKAGEECLEHRRRENMAEIASRLHEFNDEWNSRRLL